MWGRTVLSAQNASNQTEIDVVVAQEVVRGGTSLDTISIRSIPLPKWIFTFPFPGQQRAV